MSAKSPQKQHFLSPWYAHVLSWKHGVKNATLTENFAYVLKGQSLRECSIKSRYQVKKFDILNNAARNSDNAEAAIGFRK